MKLVITNKTEYNLDHFIRVYLKNYIYNEVQIRLNPVKIKQFNNYIDDDARKIILLAMRNLVITKQAVNSYEISLSKIIKYKDKSLSSWINLITYGNRDIQGYPIILNIFKNIENNIERIYRRYLRYGN